MSPKHYILLIFIVCSSGCFLIKTPLAVQLRTKHQKVYLYNIPVSSAKSIKLNDSVYLKLQGETRHACEWISNQARENGVNVEFILEWEKPSYNGNEFLFKPPSRNIVVLAQLEKWLKIHVKQKKWPNYLGWENRLLQHVMANNASDSSLFEERIKQLSVNSDQVDGDTMHIFMFYILKARTKKIAGYNDGNIIIGRFTSEVIAHEILHSFGAHDLYIHRAWIGRRRHLVKRNMQGEIMDRAIWKKDNCEQYFLSSYSRYCMGWADTLSPKFNPLLKENLMSRWIFEHRLRRGL